MARTWVRLSMVLAVGALTLGAVALHTPPAAADDGDEVAVALMEARVVSPASVRAEPVATASVVTSLGVEDAIYVIAHITDKDGVMWYQIAALNATPIGWLTASVVSLITAGESSE